MSELSVYSGPTSNADNQLRLQQAQRSTAYDPVDKIRVSSPQALIDTDFEYGSQPTKWETIALQNSRQSCYYIPQQPLTITGITGNGTTTVTITGTFNIAANSLIYIQNAADANANGWTYTNAGGTNTMTVVTQNAVASGNQYNAALSYVFFGYFYSNCGVPVSTGAFVTFGGTNVTVTTINPHGFSVGSYIYIANTTSSGTSVNGAQIVTQVLAANSFTFTNVNGSVAASAITNSAASNVVYARPSGYVESRTFDGGVAFSAGAAVPNQQLIRQTRRYFRYQSGKGIQFSTGTSLKPSIFTTSLTASGTTVTVTTRYQHNLTVGTVILVSGLDQDEYNGTYSVASVPTPTTLTYVVVKAPSVSPATGIAPKVSPVSWYGSSNRVGFFDQQNGMFFEYDGQALYAVWRTSTNQLSGTVSVTQGSSLVTGTGTQFSTQLKPNDFIVIRGQSYKVIGINSDTQIYLSPEYRGSSISGALVSKTIDTRYPQSSWSDTLDGSNSLANPSGYKLDLTKMQMWYIDFSWYGAGMIRWGLRTTNGAIIYVFSQQNNNQRFEAYMRSGNLCAHYESNGTSPSTYLTATLSSATTTGGVINVADTSNFAPSGTLKLQTGGQTGIVEYITYSAKTATTLIINSRGVQGGGGGAPYTFPYNSTSPTAVEYASPDTTATLSHWGSSVIMDGRFDDDKSLIFNYGATTAVSTSNTTPVVLLALRVAPSVDNGTTGLLGAKEIINRMQLQLDSLGIVTTGNTYLINLVLNGYASGALSGSFQPPIQQSNGITSSLAQVAVNNNNVNIIGGESVAAAYCGANSVTTLDLSNVRDLGNSILGGGTTNTIPTSQSGFYPDGPDILYVVAQAVSATSGTILARVSWKEAQA